MKLYDIEANIIYDFCTKKSVLDIRAKRTGGFSFWRRCILTPA